MQRLLYQNVLGQREEKQHVLVVAHRRVRPQLNVDSCGLHDIKRPMAPGLLNIPIVLDPSDVLATVLVSS